MSRVCINGTNDQRPKIFVHVTDQRLNIITYITHTDYRILNSRQPQPKQILHSADIAANIIQIQPLQKHPSTALHTANNSKENAQYTSAESAFSLSPTFQAFSFMFQWKNRTRRANPQTTHICQTYMISLQSSALHDQPSQKLGYFIPIYNRMIQQGLACSR